MLLARKNDSVRNDVARLAGTRFVSTAETEAGRHLAEVMVKQLAGGDTITARFLYSEFFEYSAQYKIFLATNHKPTIRGTDKGIWRRIRLIPFTITIPDGEQDKDLKGKLRAELPGILAWAVRGCLEWQKEGLHTPQEVMNATDCYRQEMDVLGAFITERCVVTPSAKVATKALYREYAEWCEENGERPLSQKEFGVQLTERGFGRSRDGKARFRLGIGLVTDVTEGDADFTNYPSTSSHEGGSAKEGSHGSHASQPEPVLEVDV